MLMTQHFKTTCTRVFGVFIAHALLVGELNFMALLTLQKSAIIAIILLFCSVLDV